MAPHSYVPQTNPTRCSTLVWAARKRRRRKNAPSVATDTDTEMDSELPDFDLQDAEAAGYNVGFITYLTRFLLNFDRDTQQYWISRTSSSSGSSSSGTKRGKTSRTELFGELAASVEVKLLDYRDAQGPSRLLSDLVQRYCPVVTPDTPKRTRREIKEARRQLALLFALLQETQPVRDLTRLLGQVDNASVSKSGVRLNPGQQVILNGFVHDKAGTG